MNIDLYNIVLQVIGELPNEYHFIYGIALIFLIVGLVFVLISPFLLAFKVIGGR